MIIKCGARGATRPTLRESAEGRFRELAPFAPRKPRRSDKMPGVCRKPVRAASWTERKMGMWRNGYVLLVCLSACLAFGCSGPRMQLRERAVVNASVTDSVFRDSLSGALRTPFLSGNRVSPLVNGDQFVPAIIAA